MLAIPFFVAEGESASMPGGIWYHDMSGYDLTKNGTDEHLKWHIISF